MTRRRVTTVSAATPDIILERNYDHTRILLDVGSSRACLSPEEAAQLIIHLWNELGEINVPDHSRAELLRRVGQRKA